MKFGCKNWNIFREKFTDKNNWHKYNLDWILEQKNGINGKTAETQKASVIWLRVLYNIHVLVLANAPWLCEIWMRGKSEGHMVTLCYSFATFEKISSYFKIKGNIKTKGYRCTSWNVSGWNVSQGTTKELDCADGPMQHV